MNAQSKTKSWRPVRHPLQLVTRKGWQFGRRSLISPRGTVFETHWAQGIMTALYARRRLDFQLNDL